ncbi:MAG TPA: 2-oxoacid:ferredoxin oxidoreductase subunit beta [Saprospiraceae bacterium]|nr:2-oxoacid:ferredoxin oxidoreductase subunit beta [Saprospiraceae bacterium]
METTPSPLSHALSPKDFVSPQDIKWCRGCGDYSILKQVQTIFPELGVPKENFVFISGIGCSSRFTYYMDSYGLHGIHGRALAIATGVKMANPELSVWVISGDGDALSIGGNHFIHTLRKNFNINFLMFNNQIYSLTKGQYSPTSVKGAVTKTTPHGSIEEPFDPVALALGAKARFVARTIDSDPKHMRGVLSRAYSFNGGSFVEIYQNCPIFNDGAFERFSDKQHKKDQTIQLEQGMPLVFGMNNEKGITMKNRTPEIVERDPSGKDDGELWIHDETDLVKASILSCFSSSEQDGQPFPRPFGVIYAQEGPVYEMQLHQQIAEQRTLYGSLTLDHILSGDKTWVIE